MLLRQGRRGAETAAMPSSTFHPSAIRIAAALITRADGRVLLVRKRGTALFLQPGGKP